MFTIVGSGFGLYGYLPALVETFQDAVVLPVRYQAKLESRPELHPYRSCIKWVSRDDEALASASGVVIATTPGEQPLVVGRCLEYGRIATLFLEKPLARTPNEASDLLSRLLASGRRFRIGYTLPHSRWAAAMDRLAGLGPGGAMTITWHFMAHHFKTGLESWKRNHSAGGGVIRFFGIHLLPLLAQQGYQTVEQSAVSWRTPDEPDRWRAAFSGPGLPICEIDVDSNSPCARFAVTCVTSDDGMPVDLNEPFELEEPVGHASADRRVAVLMRLLASSRPPDEPHYELYANVNDLWRQAEAKAAEIALGNRPACFGGTGR